jgi:hypothetical protein
MFGMLKNTLIFSSVCLVLFFAGYYAGRGMEQKQSQQETTSSFVEIKNNNAVKIGKRKKQSGTGTTGIAEKEVPLEYKGYDNAIEKVAAQSKEKNIPAVEAEPIKKTEEKRSPKEELISSMREAGLPESDIKGAVQTFFPESEETEPDLVLTEELQQEIVIKKEELIEEYIASGMPAEEAEIIVSGFSPADILNEEIRRPEMDAEEMEEKLLASFTEAEMPEEDVEILSEGVRMSGENSYLTSEEITRKEEFITSLTEAGVPEEDIEIMIEGMMGEK